MIFNLGLMITERCNIKCRHCVFGDGEIMHGGSDMPAEDMKSYIDQMAVIAGKEKMEFSVNFSGGEPFLCLPQLLEISRYAKSKGAVNVSTVTNGFWGSDEEKADKIILALKEAGLDLISLSMDDFHQEQVSLSSELTVLKLCREHHLPFGIKCVVTRKTRRLPDVLKDLGDLMLDSPITVQEISCCPGGRAASAIPKEDLFYTEGIPGEACAAGTMLIIIPDGSAYPCCGTGWSPSLYVGNAQNNNLERIYYDMKSNSVINILSNNGPAYFVPFLEKAGHTIPKEGYADCCDFCKVMLTHPAFSKILPVAGRKWRQERVKKVMADLLSEDDLPV